MARIRVFGAAGGAVFALLTLAAFLIAPGPSSANGVMVVEYYTEHGNAAIWQAVLAGFGIVFFMWFAAIFADTMSSANAVLVTAGAMAAVYLVRSVPGSRWARTTKTSTSSMCRARAMAMPTCSTDVGVGAAHLAGFADAAFVGATAAALLTSATPWRRLGMIGVGLTVVWLINAPLQIFATSDWSDAVGAIVFLSLLAWVFALSGVLVASLRKPPI